MQSIRSTRPSFLLATRKHFWPTWLAAVVMCVTVGSLPGKALGNTTEPLPAAEAFKFDISKDSGQIEARWRVAEGYYLYRDKLSFTLNDAAGNPLPVDTRFPDGHIKQDPVFGEVEVYTQEAVFRIPLPNQAAATELVAKGQGCNGTLGVCYPPMQRRLDLAAASGGDTPAMIPASFQAGSEPTSAPTSAPAQKAGGSMIWLMLTAIAAGIGLSFTPCVLPLIPILSGIIAGQGERVSKSKAASLSAAYVLGTAITYSIIGAVAGATGEQLQAYFQNAWAIGTLSLVFVVMALGMFGVITVQVPSYFQSRLSGQSERFQSGSLLPALLMGAVSALIVGACVSPILISFLGLAMAQGSALLGALSMFSLAIGMGVPLMLFGLGAGHLLPKAGKWMETVKYAFGVMLIAMAIYLLSALPEVPVLYLWAALLIILAIFLGATQPLAEASPARARFTKGVGTLSLVWGTLALVGAMYGERDLLHPLPQNLFSNAVASSPEKDALFTLVSNESELERALEQASSAKKPVVIDYYADWCTDCVKLEASTFADPTVRETLSTQYVALKVDVTDPNSDNGKALKARYGVFGPPAVVFLDQRGEEIAGQRFYGYKSASDFLSLIQK